MKRCGQTCATLLFTICTFLNLIAHGNAIGVRFTAPAGGGTWPAGLFTIAWTNDGAYPDMNELVSYTMQLIVGGNIASNSAVVAQLGSGQVTSGQLQAEIPANVSQSIQNGFYLMMTSTVNNGNQVINYSNRFTLISLNGTASTACLAGANAAAGITDVPSSQYNVFSISSTTTSAPSGSATSSSTASATDSASAHAQTQHGPPGTNLIIGLSIGLICAIALIVAMSVLALYRWRRRRRRDAEGVMKGQQAFLADKAELPAQYASAPQTPAGIELSPFRDPPGHDDQHSAVEMGDRRSIRYELEGEWAGWEAGSGRKSRAYDPTL